MRETDKKAPWRRDQAVADAPPLDSWPELSIDLLREGKKERIRRKIEAIKLYVMGLPLSEIRRQTGVPPSILPHTLQRCLELASDGRIMGFRALSPNTHLYGYTRTKEIGFKRGEQRGGMSGALSATIEKYPDIEEILKSLILKKAKQHEIPENKIRPKDLHSIFLTCLKSLGQKTSDWPFCTKYVGIRSIQKYMASVLEKHFDRAVRTREKRAAIAHLATGRGYRCLRRARHQCGLLHDAAIEPGRPRVLGKGKLRHAVVFSLGVLGYGY